MSHTSRWNGSMDLVTIPEAAFTCINAIVKELKKDERFMKKVIGFCK